MAVITSELTPVRANAVPSRTVRRLSKSLFAFLQQVSISQGTDRLTSRLTGIVEPDGQDVAIGLSLRSGYFNLPSDLKLIPDRLTQSPTIQAAGFADSQSKTVGVDVASWSRPCAPELDEIAWRRVFTWIVGTDSSLTNVSILEPPVLRDGRMVGAYGYDSSGVPGYGVLQLAASADGSWQICDCWGDAVEADRIDALAGSIPCS